VEAWWKVWKRTPDGSQLERQIDSGMEELQNDGTEKRTLERGGSRIERSKDTCTRRRSVGIDELMRCMNNKYKVIRRLVLQLEETVPGSLRIPSKISWIKGHSGLASLS